MRSRRRARTLFPTVVDVHPVRRRRGDFVSVVRGLDLRNGRPRMRVGGCFAGEVAGVQFRESGLEVFWVERDACRDLVFGVDLGDDEYLAP